MRIRRELFGNLLALAGTLVFLGVVELGLRVTGLPKEGTLFLSSKGWVRLSPRAASRYFGGHASLVPETRAEPFRHPKPPGVVRVCCIGGSTMAGYPFTYNGTLPALLTDRLEAALPDAEVEVVNLAVSAVASYTVLDLARHVMRFDPDLLVVYSGHNEFYGALGAASRVRGGLPRPLILLHLRLQDVSLYRVIWSLIGRRGTHGRPPDVTLMARMVGQPCVPRESAAYRRAVRIYAANMRDLARLCAKHRVGLVVCELVSNLRDQPPFPVCGEDGRSPAHELFASARERERKGNALEARTRYVQAKDADECRFRAPSEFNDSLRAIVPREGAVLVPLERRFFDASPFPAPGYDLFLDHLHPNLEGYLLIAEAICRSMEDHGVLGLGRRAKGRCLSLAEAREAAMVTQLEYAIAVDKVRRLMAHWPFSPDQPPPLFVFDDSLSALASRYHDERLAWSEVHLLAVNFFIRHRRYEEALDEARAVLKQAAGFWPAWLKVGDVHLAQGRWREAAQAYRTASRLDGGRGHSLAKLGAALLASGEPKKAAEVLEAARRPEAGLSALDRGRAAFLLGRAYAQMGLTDDVTRVIEELAHSPETADLAELLRRERPH